MGDRGSEAVTYLPASLVRAFAAGGPRVAPWSEEVEGTLVMADLSGFTALSERLATLGDEGAERLTDIINGFFTTMLGTASRFGGDTITFGGDAILLLFTGEGHASRAAMASLRMLKQTERVAAVEAGGSRVKLGMSVGAHSGVFPLMVAGLDGECLRLFIPGRGAERTALAEARADRGHLVVSAATAGLLVQEAGESLGEVGCDGSPWLSRLPQGFWHVDQAAALDVSRSVTAGGEPSPDIHGAPVDARLLKRLVPFLPPQVGTDAAGGAGRVALAPEHRRVCVVFVDILGLTGLIDAGGTQAALAQLQRYAELLLGLAARHRGFFVSSDIATEGTKVVLTFGAPMAHEHAAANAGRFALELDAELRQTRLSLRHRIGVNGGHVFAGEVGPAFRRQYTVMGDAVNLAARLMAVATPGQVLASHALLEAADGALHGEDLPPLKVKGKERAVDVCVLKRREGAARWRGSRASGPAHAGRLFGRRAELDLLRERWRRAQRGAGGAVLVEGEAGVGKTRLLEEALRAAPAELRVTRAACFEHLQAAPFTPWVDVLHEVLGVTNSSSTADRTVRAGAFLSDRLPEWTELSALLNPLLGTTFPHSDVVASLDSETRRERLFDLVSQVLAAAGEHGHVVLIEDVHWVDESSLALARHVAGRATREGVVLVLTSRSAAAPLDLGEASVERLVVAELGEGESLAFLVEALRVAELPADVREAIYAKTRGNPLFLEEVVHALQAPGVLERLLSGSSVRRAAELAALALPDRVQGLLMSRIDALPAGTREVLKVGAVVGRSFDVALLDGIDDAVLGALVLESAIDDLDASALVVREDGPGGSRITFRHALVQDVAYDSLPFARRRELHGAVARYLEASREHPDHGVLVHHFQRAGERGKTRLHAVRAHESSVAVYANLEAVDYLSVAMETVPAPTSRDACLRSRFEELMGDSLDTLARHEEAVHCFSRARRRWASPSVRAACAAALAGLAPVEDPASRESLLCWKIAVATERGTSSYRRALGWLDKGAATLPAERTALAARMLITRCGFLSRLGRYREATQYGEEGLALARQQGDAGLQAYALTLLALGFSGMGLLEKANACDAEATALYEQAGDLVGQAMGHANLGYGYMQTGELQASLEHNELSLTLFTRIGNIKGVATQHLNLGGVLLQLGDMGPAVRHLEQALALRDRQGVGRMVPGYALAQLCQAYVWAGDLSAAERALDEGLEILRSIEAQGLLLDAGLYEAELRLAQGDPDAAERACRAVLADARAMDAELNEAQALCLLGRIQLAQGDAHAATPNLEACLALAERSGSDYERAKGLATLAEAQAVCGLGDAACASTLDEAVTLFTQMGAGYDLARALELRERLLPAAS